tara:strand:- start:397 stop:891 length:495 start_codon:yes stop_codon:yes gene_type:complete
MTRDKVLDKDGERDILVEGAVALMFVTEDTVEQDLALVTAKIPVDLEYDGRVLRTYPEALFFDKQATPIIINYQMKGGVKTASNDIVARARLMAMHKRLGEPVLMRNYILSTPKAQTLSSDNLCDDRLDTDLAHIARAISDGYAVPPTICPLGLSCKFFLECYY